MRSKSSFSRRKRMPAASYRGRRLRGPKKLCPPPCCSTKRRQENRACSRNITTQKKGQRISQIFRPAKRRISNAWTRISMSRARKTNGLALTLKISATSDGRGWLKFPLMAFTLFTSSQMTARECLLTASKCWTTAARTPWKKLPEQCN